jgi:hypothetical protein
MVDIAEQALFEPVQPAVHSAIQLLVDGRSSVPRAGWKPNLQAIDLQAIAK